MVAVAATRKVIEERKEDEEDKGGCQINLFCNNATQALDEERAQGSRLVGRKQMTYLLSTSLRDDDDDHENEPNVARWSEVDSCHVQL